MDVIIEPLFYRALPQFSLFINNQYLSTSAPLKFRFEVHC